MNRKVILFILASLLYLSGFCQNQDSLKAQFLEKIKQAETKELTESLSALEQHKAEIKRAQVMDDLLKVSQRAKGFLKNGIDTISIQLNLKQIDDWNTIVKKGVFVNLGTIQTQRNLTVSSKLNKELIFKIEQEDKQLDEYLEQLVLYRKQMDSLKSDSSLYHFPKDTAGLIQYSARLKAIASVLRPIEANLQNAILSLENVKNKMVIQKNQLLLEYDDIQEQRKRLFKKSFIKEYIDQNSSLNSPMTINEIWHYSFMKEQLALVFYFQDNLGRIGLLLLLIVLLSVFIRSLKTKVIGNHLIFRNAFLSAIIIVFGFCQFFFQDPPFVFYFWIWLISALSLTVVFWHYISRFWRGYWLSVLTLFVFVSLDNLILLASDTERLFIASLSIIGLMVGTFYLFNWKKHAHELREKYIKYFLWVLMVLQIAALGLNVYGNYNLSKSLMVTGYFSVLSGILLLWTVRLLNDVLFYASETYQAHDKKLFYINFNKVGSRVPAFFYILLLFGWFVLVGRNFYLYNQLAEPISNWLFEERTIGEYTFSIRGITDFIVIIFIAFFASRLVSFISSDVKSTIDHGDKSGRPGLGSWILLIRIAIIITGIFLAFAAAGIPLDKITIILGALSVGIGFGLQTLINNLVSGLILAFEKPVNVGDIVEVMGKSGRMKSIGFRSSVITTWEGANLIISNGDLMNAQLLNWSQDKGFRRLELKLNIDINANLNQVIDLTNQVLNNNDDILKHPPHLVEFHQISNGAAELVILFWVRRYLSAGPVLNDLIVDLEKTFKVNQIPFAMPQQNIKIITDQSQNNA
jgi:small-conductance mechanosensitive channel